MAPYTDEKLKGMGPEELVDKLIHSAQELGESLADYTQGDASQAFHRAEIAQLKKEILRRLGTIPDEDETDDKQLAGIY